MNPEQLKSRTNYYQQNKQKVLDYQKRYRECKKNGTMPEVYYKKQIYNKYESTIVNSCIKKNIVYKPPTILSTDYVDIILQNYTHIPFTSKLFTKMLDYVSISKLTKQPITIQPKIQSHQLCRFCNKIDELYKFGDHTDNTICNNCCCDNHQLIDELTIDIVDTIIDNINTDKFNICSGFMCEECI